MTTVFPNSSNLQSGATESSRRLELDNLIRRELKVGDPNDAKQVAEALMGRYQSDARARAISQEAKGLPFLQSPSSAPAVREIATATTLDMEQAVNDVNRDLRELTTNNLLKDVEPELQGWADGIRSAIQEASSSAQFALDTRQRDKTFAIRRQLGDYALMARLVGALTPSVNSHYRNLAQSLDEVSAVLLVMMGEALANVGFAGGQYLLQTPYTELQIRRDGVIYALRNLVGSTQQAYGQSVWPYGLDGYLNLYEVLEKEGQGDLRSLLVENELARIMDELIRRAAQGTSEGLRALGATAQIDLQRFSRLIAIMSRRVNPESPPIMSLVKSLQMFVDAFKPAGGYRLLRIARPPILFYGLYGNRNESDSDKRLSQMTFHRGSLASKLDCFMGYDFGEKTVQCQIALDKILYGVDRAIDLYAVGDNEQGEPEQRAAAYGYMIEALVGLKILPISDSNKILDTMNEIKNQLLPESIRNLKNKALIERELCSQFLIDEKLKELVKTLTPGFFKDTDDVLRNLTKGAINTVLKVLPLDKDVNCEESNFRRLPATPETALSGILDDVGTDGAGRN